MRLFKQLEFIFRETDSLTRRLHRPPLPQGEGWGEGSSKRFRRSRDVDLESKARNLLRELGAAKLAREVRVEWNPRLKTAAGRADFRQKLISLNPLLRDVRAGLAFNREEIDRTLSSRQKLTPHVLFIVVRIVGRNSRGCAASAARSRVSPAVENTTAAISTRGFG